MRFAADRASSVPRKQGKRYTYGLGTAVPDVEPISMRAVVSEGSVAAAVTVSVCRHRTIDRDPTLIGGVEGDLSAFSSEVVSVDGRDLGQFGEREGLIVTVVPLVDGAVEITGFDITYRDGGGDRSEQIAAEIVIG